MKRMIPTLAALLFGTACAFAFPKALYVKQGNSYSKYNFGVADNLRFSENGTKLTITGYGETIDLNKIDYITFTAPVEAVELTPSSQKEKLVKIGEEAYRLINLYDNEELINMFNVFFSETRDASGRWQDPYAEYDVPEEYWNLHGEADRYRSGTEASPLNLIKAMIKVGKGEIASVRTMKSLASELYKVEDYFGIYSANKKTHSWEKISNADYFEIRFPAQNGDNYVARLKASKEYSAWKTNDFNGRLPKVMTVTLFKGNGQLAQSVISTEIVPDSRIDMAVDFDANGYVVRNTLNVSNSAINDRVIVTIDGKQLCDVATVVDGKNLVTYDVIRDDIKECFHYHDSDDNCCGEDPTQLIAHVFRANTNADVLGQLQVKGKIYNPSKLYELLVDEDETGLPAGNGCFYTSYGKYSSYDSKKSILDYESSDSSQDLVNRKALYLNNYSDAYFCYDKNNRLQGFLSWDVTEDVWDSPDYSDPVWEMGYLLVDGYAVEVSRTASEYYYDPSTDKYVTTWNPWHAYGYDGNGMWTSIEVDSSRVVRPNIVRHHYYEVQPMLVFTDLTSFMFEDFFDEISFRKLLDDCEEIIDTYENIVR